VFLGVMLAALTMQASGRQLLNALLLLPLATPILLSFVQVLAACLGDTNTATGLSAWLGLQLVFNVVYGTVCSVLFAELVASD